MRGMVAIVCLLSVFLVSCATDREDKVLYLCDDSKTLLLTHEASLGCPVYEPHSELITVPDGATWADVEWAVGLKLAERPSPAQQRAETVRTDPCAWLDLSLQRHITVGVEAEKDVKKWEDLSKIMPDTTLCEKYRVKKETPRF
jgi:hypothetical protein